MTAYIQVRLSAEQVAGSRSDNEFRFGITEVGGHPDMVVVHVGQKDIVRYRPPKDRLLLGT